MSEDFREIAGHGALILVVDDEQSIRESFTYFLKDNGFNVLSAVNGREAFKLLSRNPDLVLTDLYMPEKDGYWLIENIKKKYPDTPVIAISGAGGVQEVVKAIHLGAADYIPKPLEDISLLTFSVNKVLREKMLVLENKKYRDNIQKLLKERTRQLVDSQKEIIFRLATASEFRDNETGAHIKRMGHYCKLIAGEVFNFDENESENLRISAMMHDVGKIGISDNIILKPGRLTPDEFEIIKTHTSLGAKILEGDSSFYIRRGKICALTHHEKWDGSGYPRGLKGEKIPLIGRIAAAGDVFDALISERPYKKAWSFDKAAAEIIKMGGSHFDPRISKNFSRLLPDFKAIMKEYPDSQIA